MPHSSSHSYNMMVMLNYAGNACKEGNHVIGLLRQPATLELCLPRSFDLAMAVVKVTSIGNPFNVTKIFNNVFRHWVTSVFDLAFY